MKFFFLTPGLISLYLIKTVFSTLRSSPLMGFSTWEAFAKEVSEEKIIKIATILKSSGLFDKGYKMIHIDDGWQRVNRKTAWISRENYYRLPDNNRGPGGLPGLVGNGTPGCIIPDEEKFPRGMKQLSQDLKSQGFYFGLYSSGEHFLCDPDQNFDAFYASSSYMNLREIDANCFIDWGIDLLKIDACRLSNTAISYTNSVIRAWRNLLPKNVLLYNSRYGCMAQTYCGKIYQCPLNTNIKLNDQIDSACTLYSNIARTGPDIKADWDHIMTGMSTRLGRGSISKPGFWSDPDFLVPDDQVLSFKESRSQFSMWCVLSAPLLLSVDLTLTSQKTIEMLSNEDAISVNQNYYNDGGDLFVRSGSLWIFRKQYKDGEYGIVVVNVGSDYVKNSGPTQESLTWILGSIRFFSNSRIMYPKECELKNVWTGETIRTRGGNRFIIQVRDCIFILIRNCM